MAWQQLGVRRHVSALISPRRDNDLACPECCVRHGEHKIVAVEVKGGNPTACADGSVKQIGPGLEVIDQLRPTHEAVGLWAAIRRAWQLDRPVGRDEAERVPAARAPRLGDAASLEDHVLHARLLQKPAGGEPGLASADDRNPDRLGHPGGNLSRKKLSPPRRAGRGTRSQAPNPVPLSDVRGRIVEYLLAVYAMLTSGGDLVFDWTNPVAPSSQDALACCDANALLPFTATTRSRWSSSAST